MRPVENIPTTTRDESTGEMVEILLDPSKPKGVFFWMPEVEEDKDGYVHQTTFHLKSTVDVDEHGDVVREPETEQEAANMEFKSMFGVAYRDVKAIVDAMEEAEDESVSTVYLQSSLEACMEEFEVGASRFPQLEGDVTKDDVKRFGASAALDYLVDLVRDGMRVPPIGSKRQILTCVACNESLFEKGEEAPIKICDGCNGWTHKKCHYTHVCDHIRGQNCLGLRRRDDADAVAKAKLATVEDMASSSSAPALQDSVPSHAPAASAGVHLLAEAKFQVPVSWPE